MTVPVTPPLAALLELGESPAGLSLAGRLAQALIRAIREGRLTAGSRLPGTRTLAAQCGVHRNTVVAAYEELIAQGYAKTTAGSGTFVAEQMSRTTPAQGVNAGAPPRLSKLKLAPLPPATHWGNVPADTLPLLGGLPDLRDVPRAALARAYRAALKRAPLSLDYQNALAHPLLSKQLRLYLDETRGVRADEMSFISTRGSQQALHLAARALARPDSYIAVERCGYPPAWEGFRLAGARLLPVATDAQGLVVDDLKRLLAQHNIAALYVTPHHQYPTTVTLSGPRRMQLLQLARRHNFVIIEDDYDHEFHFDGRPVLPLKSADSSGNVLLVGTLSKVLAPGLRLGYAVGQATLIDAMARHRTFIDRQGDHVLELALGYLMEDGEIAAHIRRMHRSYRGRREALFHALDTQLSDELSYTRPSGGLAVWCHVLHGVGASEWAARAKELGVLVQPAGPFFFDKRSRPYLRIGYARLNEEEISEAVLRLRAAHPRYCAR